MASIIAAEYEPAAMPMPVHLEGGSIGAEQGEAHYDRFIYVGYLSDFSDTGPQLATVRSATGFDVELSIPRAGAPVGPMVFRSVRSHNASDSLRGLSFIGFQLRVPVLPPYAPSDPS